MSDTNFVFFEQPLNERIRLFLRLEKLFKRIKYYQSQNAMHDHQMCIRSLIELSELTNRGDINTDAIKEIERHQQVLQPLLNQPKVENQRLQPLLIQQEQLLHKLYDHSGNINACLRNDDMLTSIQQRICIPGGGCDFDLPQYHRWLHLPLEEKNKQISNWLKPFKTIQEALCLCLQTLRFSERHHRLEAKQGYYEQSLSRQHPVQLLRIALPHESPHYPEISAGKHRFSVRFFTLYSTTERPAQSQNNISFTLFSCGL